MKITVAMTVTFIILSLGTSQAQQAKRAEANQRGQSGILCAWVLYAAIQQGVEACSLEPRPSDLEMQRATRRIEEFSLANTTKGLTQEHFDEYERQNLEVFKTATPQNFEAMCNDIRMMRDGMGDSVVADTDALLSVPREPELGECL